MSDVLKDVVIVVIIIGVMALCVVVWTYLIAPDHVEPTPVTEYQLSAEMQELRTSVDALVEKMLEYEQAKKEARGGE